MHVWLRIAIVWVIVCVAGVALAGRRSAAPAQLKQAQTAKRNGDYDKALLAIEKGLSVAPQDAPLLQLKGSVLLDLEDYLGALAAYEAFLAVAPPGGERKEAENIVKRLAVVRTTVLHVNVQGGSATIRKRKKAVLQDFCVAAPTCDQQVLPRKYSLIAERAGYVTWTGEVTAVSGTTTTVEITLQEKPSLLTVTAVPADAQVTVDGTPYDAPREVAAGAHQVEASAPGRATRRLEAVAREGKPVQLTVELPRVLEVQLAPTTATLTLDGKPVKLEGGKVELPPGEHELIARAPGHRERRQRIAADPIAAPLRLALEVIPVAPPSPSLLTGRRKLALAGAGVSVAALAGGALLGVSANGLEDDSFDVCPVPDSCDAPERANDLIERARSRALQANIAYGVAGVAAIAAAALWFTGAPETPALAVTPRVDAGSAGLELHLSF
jgi:Tetratricopeptide repeat